MCVCVASGRRNSETEDGVAGERGVGWGAYQEGLCMRALLSVDMLRAPQKKTDGVGTRL